MEPIRQSMRENWSISWAQYEQWHQGVLREVEELREDGFPEDTQMISRELHHQKFSIGDFEESYTVPTGLETLKLEGRIPNLWKGAFSNEVIKLIGSDRFHSEVRATIFDNLDGGAANSEDNHEAPSQQTSLVSDIAPHDGQKHDVPAAGPSEARHASSALPVIPEVDDNEHSCAAIEDVSDGGMCVTTTSQSRPMSLGRQSSRPISLVCWRCESIPHQQTILSCVICDRTVHSS